MDRTEEMDMRTLVPIERHKKLLQVFKDLPVGERFVFINDHDPIPLYYEFRSIHGDVVGWEYLHRGGHEWKVQVTREEVSQGRELIGVSTLLDLRKAGHDQWKQIVFHRYGMMETGDTMELIAAEDPAEIREIFARKFEGKHSWRYQQQEPGEIVVHITKDAPTGLGDEGYAVVADFDVRPYPASERHEMFYKAFADLKPGEAFQFTNDHDPKPLYYQIEAESKEPFRWEYLDKGPDQWRVRVIKTGEIAA